MASTPPPASVPAESNQHQQAALISPVRSGTAGVYPSSESLAPTQDPLTAGHGASSALHTPVQGAEGALEADVPRPMPRDKTSEWKAQRVARRKQQRAAKAEAKRLVLPQPCWNVPLKRATLALDPPSSSSSS